MGCYNTVIVNCPHCSSINEEQTKNGSCDLETYNLHNAPVEDILGVSGYVIKCTNCNERFVIKNQVITKSWVEKYE